MKSTMQSRRGFIKQAALGAIGVAGAQAVFGFPIENDRNTKEKEKVILFQGDSITDH